MPDQPDQHNAHNVPALYIVATPIGNLQDITFRAVQTLKDVDVIACEDTRVSKKLMNHYGIPTPLLSYHEHNAAMMRPKILSKISAGKSVALISDAGTPLISDPGYKLVEECYQAGIRVVPIPGSSAVMANIMAGGLPSDQFAFIGFLPLQRSHATELLARWKAMPITLVCFTTASKIITNLECIHEALGECQVSLGRELTKLHEEFIRSTASELLARLKQNNTLKGEMVLALRALHSPQSAELQAEKTDALLADLLGHMPLKLAVDVVVRHCGASKNAVYQRALEIKP